VSRTTGYSAIIRPSIPPRCGWLGGGDGARWSPSAPCGATPALMPVAWPWSVREACLPRELGAERTQGRCRANPTGEDVAKTAAQDMEDPFGAVGVAMPRLSKLAECRAEPV